MKELGSEVINVRLPRFLVRDVRHAIRYLDRQAKGPREMRIFVEEAMRRQLERLHDEYNQGRPFPAHRPRPKARQIA